jgi:hypothetical protein
MVKESSMNGLDVYLVGNRFSEFAVQPGVQTVSEFLTAVRDGVGADGTTRLFVGQGVTNTDWLEILVELAVANLLDRVALPTTTATPVCTSVVHKARAENVLITDPREVSAGRFAADLRLDPDNELLIDHITGQHVPGMAIIEAARQMMMAVSNTFYLPMLAKGEYGYVLNSIDCRFERYLFPLPAVLEMTMESAEESRPRRMEFAASVTIRQAGMVAAECSARYFAYESTALSRYERTLSGRALAMQRDKIDHVVRISRPTPVSAPA